MYLNKQRKKSIWLLIVILFALLGFVLFLYRHQTTKNYVTAGPATKGPSTELPQKKGDKSSHKTTQSTDESPSTQNTTSKNNTPPEQPTGIFISNHRPSLSGENLANQINSSCATTSGATCTIVLSKDGKNVPLPEQETDNGGSTYWTWKLQDYGITEGTWSVNAIATLNGKTSSTKDSIDMVVSK